MHCDRIKEIIPGYVNHSALEKDVQAVEEHLCVCQSCRKYLGNFLDNNDIALTDSTESAPKDVPRRKIDLLTWVILIIGVLIYGFMIFLFLS